MWHTKMHFPAKCNSGQIAIQWFHIKRHLDYQYTKFQPYTFRVQKMCFCTIRDFGSPTIYFSCTQDQDFSCFTHMRKFYLAYPVPTRGKDKIEQLTPKDKWRHCFVKWCHHVMSHLGIFRDFLKPCFKHKMRYLMVSKKKDRLFVWRWDRIIIPSESSFNCHHSI